MFDCVRTPRAPSDTLPWCPRAGPPGSPAASSGGGLPSAGLSERVQLQPEVRNEKSRLDASAGGEGAPQAPAGSAPPSVATRGSTVVARRRLNTSPATGAARRSALVREADRASERRRAPRESGRGRAGGVIEHRLGGGRSGMCTRARGGTAAPQPAGTREEAADRVQRVHHRAIRALPS